MHTLWIHSQQPNTLHEGEVTNQKLIYVMHNKYVHREFVIKITFKNTSFSIKAEFFCLLSNPTSFSLSSTLCPLKSFTRFLEELFCPNSLFQITENLPPLISCYFVTKNSAVLWVPCVCWSCSRQEGSRRQAVGWEQRRRELTVRESVRASHDSRSQTRRPNKQRTSEQSTEPGLEPRRERENRKGETGGSSGIRWHSVHRLPERVMSLARFPWYAAPHVER